MRINVFLKRSGGSQKPNSFKFNFQSSDFDYYQLTLRCGSKVRKLTQREADVLKYFCLNQGKVIRREEILLEIWGDDDYFNGRSLDVFITRLRKYLKYDRSVRIDNYHGIGFMFKTTEHPVYSEK